MPAPRTEKQLRGFLGCLNFISRFISNLTATCEPILKLLHKDKSIVWNEDYQKYFNSIKGYFLEPHILIPLVEGKSLVMYLIILEGLMGFVLRKQDETGRKKHIIYYLSKKFINCES